MLHPYRIRQSGTGFTLIELLIVVAIIAILAAIAVPNFLEAQTRAKVSRVAADLRTYDTAMQTYRIDHNKLPPTYRSHPQFTRKWITRYLTTPIAYLNNALPDPFNTDINHPQNRDQTGKGTPDNMVIIAWGPDHYLAPGNVGRYPSYFQMYPQLSDGSRLLRKNFAYIYSLGPDKQFDILDGKTPRAVHPYDASNGTLSRGEVARVSM